MSVHDPARWYLHAFDADYLARYAHRDDAEAARAVDLLLAALGAPPDGPVLDLACGGGRHAAEMARRGLEVVGLDLSADLLVRARIDHHALAVVRADMRRLPFADATFAVVANFFTSFGYFDDEADDVRVAAEVARVLRPGGAFLWDHINPDHLREHFRERSERRDPDGTLVRETRSLDPLRRRVTKRIHLLRPDGDERLLHERVRFYEPDAAVALFDAAGLRLAGRWGDYDPAAPFGPHARRQILLLRRDPA